MFEKNTNHSKDINLIPLINIILLLLIFFMVIGATSSNKELSVELPLSTQDNETLLKSYSIDINSNNMFFLDGSPVDENKLSVILNKLSFDKKAKINISVNADLRASAISIINLIKILEKSSINNIVLNTKLVFNN